MSGFSPIIGKMNNRLLLKAPDEWTAADVQQLLVDQLPEGQRLEYKAALLLDSKKQKAEAAKDISGMANAQGGWIIFGIAEGDGEEPLPSQVTPLPATGLQTRLENILDTSLEPIPDYQAATISIEESVVIVVRVSKGTQPVMVQGYDQNRYFIRSGTRTRPMNAREVAQAHAVAQQKAEAANERMRDLPLIADIGPGISLPLMAEMEATPVFSVVVVAVDGPEELINRSLIRRDSFADNLTGYRKGRAIRKLPWTITAFGLMEEERLDPPEPSDYLSIRPNVDADDDRLKIHRVGVYRTGVVEWAHRYPREQILPSSSMADDLHNALLFGARVFEEAGYAGRLKIWIQIEYAEEAVLDLPPGWDINPRQPGLSELGFTCESTTEQLLADPTPVTKAALDAIWQGFGLDHCVLFDDAGNWRD